MTTRRSTERPRRRRQTRPVKPYMLVSQTPDGRLRTERFESAAGYRLGLAARHAEEQGVSLEDVIELLNR